MTGNEKARETVLVITVGCVVLYLVFKRIGFLYAAVALGLAGLFLPAVSRKIDWLWTGLSQVLGKISNTLLLSIVYLLVVTPVGLVRRWRGKDRMRRFDPKATSNFSDRDHDFAAKDLEKTW